MEKQEYLANRSVKDFMTWLENRLDKPGSLDHGFYMKKARMKWHCQNVYNAYEKYHWPFSRLEQITVMGIQVTKY